MSCNRNVVSPSSSLAPKDLAALIAVSRTCVPEVSVRRKASSSAKTVVLILEYSFSSSG